MVGKGNQPGEKQAEQWESHDSLFVTKQWHGYSVRGSIDVQNFILNLFHDIS